MKWNKTLELIENKNYKTIKDYLTEDNLLLQNKNKEIKVIKNETEIFFEEKLKSKNYYLLCSDTIKKNLLNELNEQIKEKGEILKFKEIENFFFLSNVYYNNFYFLKGNKKTEIKESNYNDLFLCTFFINNKKQLKVLVLKNLDKNIEFDLPEDIPEDYDLTERILL